MFSPLDKLVVVQLFGGGRLAGEAYEYDHGNGLVVRCIGHAGIDFEAAIGTGVRAMKGGILSISPNDPWNGGYASGLGLYAVITLPNGETHTYAHLSSVNLKPGPILPTTVFALSGDSGNVTGPHLHIGVRPPNPDYLNHYDGTVEFITHFNHDILIDVSQV